VRASRRRWHAYLFTGGISVAKLKDNMIALDGSTSHKCCCNTNTPPGVAVSVVSVEGQAARIANLPSPGLIEGLLLQGNGTY